MDPTFASIEHLKIILNVSNFCWPERCAKGLMNQALRISEVLKKLLVRAPSSNVHQTPKMSPFY